MRVCLQNRSVLRSHNPLILDMQTSDVCGQYRSLGTVRRVVTVVCRSNAITMAMQTLGKCTGHSNGYDNYY
jgi:hypothetical protein